jgi:hypothetical protein
MCGDIVYDLQNAVIDPYHVSLDREPQTTGNHAMTKRQEKAAIKKALNSGTFFLTGHDYPARLEHGRIVARLVEGSVPGPEVPVEHRFTSETHEPGHGHEEWLPRVRV